MITFALAKGRLAQGAMEIFEKAGADCSVLADEKSRKLVRVSPDGQYRYILVKPVDVPVYVSGGVADVGVVGRDTLAEAGLPLFEMVDLKFGACRMCVCGFPQDKQRLASGASLRVATKYPRIAREWFARRGIHIEVIPLQGSVELGPLVGLSDVIVDIVESGGTLRANGLEVLEEIFHSSARLVVNRASLKVKAGLREFVEAVGGVIG
ncbi:MAG: ATP phosphoribosyltransferase [Clostridia bacterium]|nr:ATP phosphoribosyltransferase [Clostridia bacterium]